MSEVPELNDKKDKNKKVIQEMFLEFFRHASFHFKGRIDEGNISIKEMNEFIEKWVNKHFAYED